MAIARAFTSPTQTNGIDMKQRDMHQQTCFARAKSVASGLKWQLCCNACAGSIAAMAPLRHAAFGTDSGRKRGGKLSRSTCLTRKRQSGSSAFAGGPMALPRGNQGAKKLCSPLSWMSVLHKDCRSNVSTHDRRRLLPELILASSTPLPP